MKNTVINQFLTFNKIPMFHYEFYEFIFKVINNLIETNLNFKDKIMFINLLLFSQTVIVFKNNSGNIVFGSLAKVLTFNEYRMPKDITARTLNGDFTNLFENEYVMMYNPLPVNYLRLKIDEISKIEKVISYRRKLYKMPIVFLAESSKDILKINTALDKIFSIDEVVSIQNSGFNLKEKLIPIELNIEYITDKLLNENESLKEDILEVIGIYKNTSINRERVNESELIVNNSLTTVNKIGLYNQLNNFINEVNKMFNTNYEICLNIDKIFDDFRSKENRGVEYDEN